MIKKILAAFFGVVFIFASVFFFDQADVLADRFDTNAQLFDFVSVILFFSGLLCSAPFNDDKPKRYGRVD